MENRQQKREDTHHSNGIDKGLSAATAKSAKLYSGLSESAQGYVLITGGVILLLYAFGYFDLLNWVIALGALALIVYGAAKANLFEKTQHFVTYLRNKYKK